MKDSIVRPAATALCGLLLVVAAPLRAQSILPARFLPGDTAIGAAAGDQIAPQIARGGNQFLVVWQDSRPLAAGETGTGIDIYGMRLDAAGNLLDPLPIAITRGAADQTGPRLSWNGQNWLVAWDTQYVGPTGYYTQAIQAARVSPAGAVLDAVPLTIAKSTNQSIWALASDGLNWAIVYQGSDRGNDIWGVRLSASGQLLDSPAVLVLPAAYYMRFNFTLAFSGGNYLFAWKDLNDLQGLVLNSALQPAGAAPVTLAANNQSIPALAANSAGFFFSWLQQQPDFTVAVVGSRIAVDGTVLDQAGINISRANAPQPSPVPQQVLWNGASWVVTWPFGGLSIARVATTGAVLDPGGRQVANITFGPAALTAVGGFQVAFTDGLYTDYQPYNVKSVAISNTLIAGVPKTCSLGAPAQAYPDIAAGDGGWMAVYRSATSADNRIFAQPLDAFGQPATAEPVLLDSGARMNGPDLPAVAWNGTYYFAVWMNPSRGGVVGLRLLPDGAKVDSAPFLIMPGLSPDVAALGDTFLVVSVFAPSNPQLVFPFGVRVNGSTGQILDAAPILLGGSYSLYPAVAALGARWVVLWQENISHDNPHGSVVGTFLSPAGAPQDPFTVASLLTTAYRGPQVAANGAGSEALISYEDETISAVETDILFRRIRADGAFLDASGVPLTAQPGNQFRTAAAWNGIEYVVAWQDQRNRTSILDILDARTDVFAARVSPSGAVIDPNGFLVAATAGGDILPIAAGKANGETVLGAIVPLGAPYAASRLGYNYYPPGNRWPVVAAAAAPHSGDIPLAVSFSAAGSADPDGSLATYSWDFGDGTTGSGPSPAHTYSEPADFVTTLTVTDNSGAASSTAVLVRATLVNQPPVAAASADKLSGPAPLAVVLNGNASFDPDGQIAQFLWTFSDGGTYFGSVAYHTFSTPGTYTATLTLTDDRGASAGTTLTFNVGPLNQPPIAVAAANPATGKAPLTVQFSSAGSSDPDGAIAAYLWNFGDGATSPDPNPSHVYLASGTYLAALTVTDNVGVSATSGLLSVTVNPLLAKMVCIGITMRGRAQAGGFHITGNATFTDSTNLALPGVSVTGEWTSPGGARSTQVVQTTRTGAALFAIDGPAGTYVLRIVDATRAGYIFDKAHSVLSGAITR